VGEPSLVRLGTKAPPKKVKPKKPAAGRHDDHDSRDDDPRDNDAERRDRDDDRPTVTTPPQP